MKCFKATVFTKIALRQTITTIGRLFQEYKKCKIIHINKCQVSISDVIIGLFITHKQKHFIWLLILLCIIVFKVNDSAQSTNCLSIDMKEASLIPVDETRAYLEPKPCIQQYSFVCENREPDEPDCKYYNGTTWVSCMGVRTHRVTPGPGGHEMGMNPVYDTNVVPYLFPDAFWWWIIR